jgi:hypothetical protein
MLSTSDVKLLKTLIRTETEKAVESKTPKIIQKVILKETPAIVRSIIQEETPAIVRNIIQEETPKIVKDIIKKETAPIKKAIAKIQKDITILINYFDHQIIDLRTRIERIEKYLGLSSN